jgi:alkylated DNA repair dioxygenase AlkB
MDLFGYAPTRNLLPYDGEVFYHGPILNAHEAGSLLHALLTKVPWKNDEGVFYGKHIIAARKVAWYGDLEYAYTYSGTTKQALPWTHELLSIRNLVEERTAISFNSCLLNLYQDGSEGMGWHSDDEKSLGRNTPIASLSFGAERKFSFRHNQTRESLSLVLENGSLLVMQGTTQTYWQHCVPKSKKITMPRVSLTFRTIVLNPTKSRP